MTLSRWSLDRLLLWMGTAVLIVLFVPMGFYMMRDVSLSAERSLDERGQSLIKTLAGQIVEPMLLDDRLTLHDALHKAASTDKHVRYLCVANAEGEVVAHTFSGGHPSALSELWEKSSGPVVRFRTEEEALLDISLPILSGRLGTLHVGMSRAQAVVATDRLRLMIGIALAAALLVILVGARIIAARVSKPLRELEKQVSVFPHQANAGVQVAISGTREVESLAKGFADMAGRLESLEQERVAIQQRMVHAERLAALGEMAAGLAHEIHNPLDGMLECLRYLETDPDKSGRASKYYPMLQDGLERIARVMQEMLTFARSGRKVSIEPYPVGTMLEALALLVQAHMNGRNVNLKWQKPGGGCVCLCDRQGLGQAGLNLVLNATEAVEEGLNPEVRMRARCDASWVYFSVEDSGPGVPEELRNRIFEPFFTTKPFGKGTGLGLSVSRQLMRAAGGDVELSPETSSLGGACFIIKLPKVPSSENRHDENAS